MNMLVPVTQSRDAMLLGTAAWYRAEDDIVHPFRPGDFWLGRLTSGVPLGFRDDRHVAIVAGTRGGKGTSIIVPNLCLWPGSAVVIDPKGENAVVTARVRGKGSRYCHGMGQTVRILDPFNAVKTEEDDFADVKACFNPLDIIDINREESVDEAARIADALIVSEASNDPFWEESARALLKALILHVATWRDFKPEERNLVTVRRLLMAGDSAARKLAEMNSKKNAASAFEFLFRALKKNTAFDGVIADMGEMFLGLEQKGERVLASIAQVACTNTDFIDSPGMKRCLSRSTFQLDELKNNPKGTSLYISLPHRFTKTHFRWLRMMVTLTLTEMEKVSRQPACGHPVLTVLDEFPALRRMQVVEDAAAQIAGFGVKLVFTVQTLPQLKDLYKDNWETLIANAGVKLFFCNDDHTTRQYASNLIGDTELVRTVRTSSSTTGTSQSHSNSTSTSFTSGESSTTSFSGGRHSTSNSSSSSSSVSRSQSNTSGTSKSETGGFSETIQKRALVTPDEVGRLFGDRDVPTALALISGYQPIFLRRSFYYQEPTFKGHYDWHPAHTRPMLLADAKAFQEELERREREAARQHADELFRRGLAERQKREDQLREQAAWARRQAEEKAWYDRQREDRERIQAIRDVIKAACTFVGAVGIFMFLRWLMR